MGTPPTEARERIGTHFIARRRQRRVGDDEGAGLERFPPLFLQFTPRGPQALIVNTLQTRARMRDTIANPPVSPPEQCPHRTA